MRQGGVIWITGLSGAGKTTLAKALLPLLPQPVILLDGDSMRDALTFLADGYDQESRKKLALTYARLCRLIAEQGATVVCATISMFHGVRAWNRSNLPGYVEIFLDVPQEVRRQRDPKGLYAAEEAGALCDMAGSDTPVELPASPDILLRQEEYAHMNVGELAEHVATRICHMRNSPRP